MHHHHHHHRGSTRITIGGNAGAIVNIVVMFFVGLMLLGMGVVFVGIALKVPILRSGFLLTGGVLAPTGLVMFGVGILLWLRRANAQRLKASGVPGQAQIIGLTQTSFFVNGQPVMDMQLQIATAMHAPYVVSKRETVPQFMMARLTSGQPLPVMVDPARPDNVVILWESMGFIG